jgi:hypothetical protein
MNGVLFSRFLRFAEDEFGAQADGLAGRAEYSPGGAYDARELLELARRLGEATGLPPDAVLRRFGVALFAYFARMYPVFFAGADSTLGFLGRVETYIHGELLKIYPDAQFPHFDVARPSDDRLELTYRSPRRLADLAEGLIRGCADHFAERIDCAREDLPSASDETVRFVLTRPRA